MTLSRYVGLITTSRKREEAQLMAEYAVVLAVITIAVVGVFTALSGGISNALSNAMGVM